MLLGERKWTEAGELTDRVVVLPLGSMEQHGQHLPLLTDTMIATEIARRAESELGDMALFLPTLWAGASDHHRRFAGTISIRSESYVRVLADMLESLIDDGFRRIFLLNAHAGNITPSRMAIYDAQVHHSDKLDLWLAFSTWSTIAAQQVAGLSGLEQKSVTHACEQETSMILHLRPDLVTMEAARGVNAPFESAFYNVDLPRSSRVDVPRSFEQWSTTGAFGHPEVATAEKGEALLSVVVGEVVAFVREFATWPARDPQ